MDEQTQSVQAWEVPTPAPQPAAAPEPETAKALVVLTREQILQTDDIVFEDVEIPGWGGLVRVKCLTGEERDTLEQSAIAGRGKDARYNWINFRAKLVVAACVGTDGKRLFSSKDIEVLGRKNVAALDKIAEVAQRLSAISEKDVEELVGNSGGDQSGSSIFG